jgi:hypothetical protein
MVPSDTLLKQEQRSFSTMAEEEASYSSSTQACAYNGSNPGVTDGDIEPSAAVLVVATAIKAVTMALV